MEESDIFISFISVIDIDSILSINVSECFDVEICSIQINGVKFFFNNFFKYVVEGKEDNIVYFSLVVEYVIRSDCSINNF